MKPGASIIKANAVEDLDVGFIALVKRGANRTPFRIFKSEEDPTMPLDLSTFFRKADDAADAAAIKPTPDQLAAAAALLKSEGFNVLTPEQVAATRDALTKGAVKGDIKPEQSTDKKGTGDGSKVADATNTNQGEGDGLPGPDAEDRLLEGGTKGNQSNPDHKQPAPSKKDLKKGDGEDCKDKPDAKEEEDTEEAPAKGKVPPQFQKGDKDDPILALLTKMEGSLSALADNVKAQGETITGLREQVTKTESIANDAASRLVKHESAMSALVTAPPSADREGMRKAEGSGGPPLLDTAFMRP